MEGLLCTYFSLCTIAHCPLEVFAAIFDHQVSTIFPPQAGSCYAGIPDTGWNNRRQQRRKWNFCWTRQRWYLRQQGSQAEWTSWSTEDTEWSNWSTQGDLQQHLEGIILKDSIPFINHLCRFLWKIVTCFSDYWPIQDSQHLRRPGSSERVARAISTRFS